jgi:ubiquinone/menaquinone biosynthesis C-methylase UbiE
MGDWLTDRMARRPAGWLGRCFYREACPHHQTFHDTLEALALTPDDRLLEIGCGGGTFLEWALRSVCSAKAIDHSPEMVRLASERNAEAIREGRLQVLEGEAERLPFADGEFTCTAMTNVFFFLHAPAVVLAEVHRVLADHGRLAIYTAATAWMAPPPIARRMRFYEDEQLAALLTAVRFVEVAVRRRGPGGRMQLATGRRA